MNTQKVILPESRGALPAAGIGFIRTPQELEPGMYGGQLFTQIFY